MVYGFVQQSGGDVAIESAAGRGTSIRISFPAAAARLVGGGEEPGELTFDFLPVNGETVLVVEDELAVREVATSTLESLGFVVIQAETGDEALAALDRDPSVRLVFSDIRMPGRLTGIELGEVVKSRWPGIAMLLTSGFVEEGQDFSGYDFLQKPYRASELVNKVRSMFQVQEPEQLRA